MEKTSIRFRCLLVLLFERALCLQPSSDPPTDQFGDGRIAVCHAKTVVEDKH